LELKEAFSCDKGQIARADIIVTGDKGMLRLREYGEVKIVILKKYFEF